MYDAITHKLPKQISWGWSGIEDYCWTFAYPKRNRPKILRNSLQSYISVSVDLRKCCNFAQNPRPMSSHFNLSRDILDKKLPFSWFSFLNWMKNSSFWYQKADYSVTQSTDILKTPTTISRWKKVNHPSYSNFGINSQS